MEETVHNAKLERGDTTPTRWNQLIRSNRMRRGTNKRYGEICSNQNNNCYQSSRNAVLGQPRYRPFYMRSSITCIKRRTDGRNFFVKSIFWSMAPTMQSSTHSHTSSRLRQEKEEKKDFHVIITSILDVGLAERGTHLLAKCSFVFFVKYKEHNIQMPCPS